MAEYEYSQLKGVIKVGNTVRAVKGKRNPCNELKNDGSNTGKITEVHDEHFATNGCTHGYNENWYLEIVKSNKTIMTKLNVMMKKLLSKDTQTFIKADFINGDLELTETVKDALAIINFETHKVALLKVAEEKLEEEAEESK